MKNQGKSDHSGITSIPDISFKVMAELSPTGIYVTNTDGKCIYVNPAWCRTAGLSFEEAMGDGWIKAIHPDDLERIYKEWSKFINEEIPWSSEYRFKDERGNVSWVFGVATLLLDSFGSVQGVIGTNLNISDRKKYEAELKESGEKLRLAAKATGFGIYSYDFESGKAYFSKEFLDLYGLSEGENVELDQDLVAKAIAPDDKKRFLQAMQDANDPTGSGILDVEFRIFRKDGAERWLKTRGLTEFSGHNINDLPKRASGILQDITERKKTERRVKAYQQKLQKLNDYLQDVREDERSQIALNLHDDFGQRLTALNLDIAWLRSRIGVQSLGVRKKLDEMSQLIHESIETIKEVSSLLRPAMLYDLGLVEAFGWQLKEFEKQSGINTYFSYDHKDYNLDNNISLMLYRILQEALTNIIRHSEATSAVVSLSLVRKKIELIIKDNGKGIDESELNSLKSMGLAGLKERVRSVSGQVLISGQKGEGTTIKISVPLKHRKNYDQNTNN